MPVIVDGVTIQQCGGVSVDNLYMEYVHADSVVVYDEVCFQGIWSGDTLLPTSSQVCCGSTCYQRDKRFGIDTNGNQYRIYVEGGLAGSWITSNENGLGSGISEIVGSSIRTRIVANGTTLKIEYVCIDPYTRNCVNTGEVTLDISTGNFSGESLAQADLHTGGMLLYTSTYDTKLETSNGQLRISERVYDKNTNCTLYNNVGAWINIS